jgi:hypothetical protein
MRVLVFCGTFFYDLMLMLQLYMSLWVCNVFSCSFLPVACPHVESALSARMAYRRDMIT